MPVCDEDWQLRIKDCVPKSYRQLADDFEEKLKEIKFVNQLDIFLKNKL